MSGFPARTAMCRGVRPSLLIQSSAHMQTILKCMCAHLVLAVNDRAVVDEQCRFGQALVPGGHMKWRLSPCVCAL
eukprot:m.72562 g.72562  ORF g.72562 m.72562 type:complete len:75 (+) comp8000_c0_seq4:619-843(+)